MTIHAWENYKLYAWGKNELRPLSKRAHTGSIFGAYELGATIVDGLDTLYIMDLKQEYQEGREWVEQKFSFKNLVSESIQTGDMTSLSEHSSPPNLIYNNITILLCLILFIIIRVPNYQCSKRISDLWVVYWHYTHWLATKCTRQRLKRSLINYYPHFKLQPVFQMHLSIPERA